MQLNRKWSLVIVGAVTATLAGTAAGDVNVAVPDFSIGNQFHGPSGGQNTFVYTQSVNTTDTITGLLFDGTVTSASGAYQRDLLLTVLDPDGNTWQFGGRDTTTLNPWTAAPSGGTIDLTQKFSDVFGPGVTTSGDWQFTFTYDWSGAGSEAGALAGHQWSGVSITLQTVPAPGALALLGMAMMPIASGRRRRTL